MIAIIDYDAGNIRSVEKALLALGQDVTVTADRDEILHADKVILPGVGAFGDAMEKLKKREHHFLEFALDCSFYLSTAMRLRV